MRKQWTAALGILVLTLAIGGWAEAVPVNSCGAPSPAGVHRVSLMGSAVAIGTNGYDNPNCHLIIDVSIPVTVTKLTIVASDITVDPSGGPTPGVVVEIINNAAASETSLIAEHTDIVFSEASIKAHKKLVIQCKGAAPLDPADCKITSDLSELIASLNFGPPPTGGSGDLHIRAVGNVDIQTTSVHGAGRLEITSSNGSLTLLCQTGEGGCKDPVKESNVSVELCGTCPPGDTCPPDPRVPPAVFPCTKTFPAAADLQAVCIKTPGVNCNGGSVEKRFTAKGDINITGSEISAIEHMTFDSKAGRLRAHGAKLTAESLVFQIKGDGTSPSIDLSNATLNTSAHTTITAFSTTGPNTGCPPLGPPDGLIPPGPGLAYPNNVCINANGLVMQASNIIMTASNNNGLIDLCGTAAADPTKVPTVPPQAAGATLVNDVGADFSTINGDSTGGPAPAAYSRVVGGVETILNGTAECTAPAVGKFGAYIDCSGAGGSCPPGLID